MNSDGHRLIGGTTCFLIEMQSKEQLAREHKVNLVELSSFHSEAARYQRGKRPIRFQ